MCMLPPDTDAFLCISPEIVEEQRITYKTYNSEKVAKWDPKDFIRTLRILARGIDPQYGYVFVSLSQMEDLFAVLSEKIFIWEKEDKISFKEMSYVVFSVSTIPMGTDGGLLCEMCTLGYYKEVFTFLQNFLALCERNVRYYDLLETLLIRRAKPKDLPLFIVLYCIMKEEFLNLLFSRLPGSLQFVLRSLTYRDYDENERLWYRFSLSGNSVETNSRNRKVVKKFDRPSPNGTGVKRNITERDYPIPGS